MKPYIALIRNNLRLMGRDRAVLFFSLFFPLVFFFIFAQSFDARQSPAAMAQVISMVLVIGVLGGGFFGAGMRAIQERETNVLRRFKVAPIGPAPIIVASMVSGLVSFLPGVALFFFFGATIYHMPLPHNLLSLFIFVSIGILAFRSMGMIVASVVNSAQEGQLVTQLLYLPMLFSSGATFPLSFMPKWIQTSAQFLPATYLFQGIQSILIGGESIVANWSSVAALVITLAVALFVGVKLFRWEKEERIEPRAKAWILVVLAPFIIMGVYQAKSQGNVEKAKLLSRSARRSRSFLITNTKIFVGNGVVIERGAVLIRSGKIQEVYNTPPENAKSLNAEVIDGAGKTLMPGLIDMHVHLGAPGGIYDDPKKYAEPGLDRRRLEAYLYSGITAVRSTGDWLSNSLKLRADIKLGRYVGAELFACGPLFTAEGGHGTEYYQNLPPSMQKIWEKEFVRIPTSIDEARTQVDALKAAGVDGIKAVLESGTADFRLFNHMDESIYRAVVRQANTDGLPVATHTGNSADVREAVDAGSNSIEHGSMTDLIPAETFAVMKQKGVAYDPTLTVFEAVTDAGAGNFEPLTRSLVQQVGPADLLASTRSAIQKRMAEDAKQGKKPRDSKPFLDRLNQNLLAAYKAGVLLITGSDAGNLMVVHGPTIQREMQLWVKAGITPTVALQAATYNAAKVLRADDRIGSIQKGRDATILLLDGDPTQNIADAERIARVMFRGEMIDRPDLFTQD